MNTPPVDYSALRFWFAVGQWLTTILVGVYVWISNRTQANADEVKTVEKNVGTLETRVAKLETDMAHTLSHEDLGAVYERINDVGEDVAELSGKMDSVRGTLDMIQDHLLNGKGRTQ